MVSKGFNFWRAAGWGGAVGVLLIATLLPAGAGDPPAQGEANVRMNEPQLAMPEGRLGRPAQAVAADRTGKFVVAAWETLKGTCGAPFGGPCAAATTPGVTAIGYSVDGGLTWKEAGAPFLGENIITSGHPWLDRGGVDDQTFFLASRARTAAPVPQDDDMPGGAGQLGLVLYRGRFQDGVLKWNHQHLFTSGKPIDLLRSPTVVAAKDKSGKVYLTLSRLLGMCGLPAFSCGQIEVFRSTDDGETWAGPVVVGADDSLVTPDPKDPKCGSQGTYQLSSSAALGTKGEVYLAWQFGPRVLNPYQPVKTTHTVGIRFSRSTDGGRTFTAPRDLLFANSMSQNAPVGYSKNGLKDYPRIAVAEAGPHRGRIYITYASAVREVDTPTNEQSVVSSQVFLIFSDDQGTSWSKPTPLGPPVPPTGVKRFWPVVAVRNTGAVDVVYLESQERQATSDPDDVECRAKIVFGKPRTGKVSSLVDLYWAQSPGGGETFGPPTRISTATSNWCKTAYDIEGTQFANFGDFLGLFAADDRSFAVWPDGRNGVPDAYCAVLPSTRTAQAGKRK